jgi:hypothetical protein
MVQVLSTSNAVFPPARRIRRNSSVPLEDRPASLFTHRNLSLLRKRRQSVHLPPQDRVNLYARRFHYTNIANGSA